MTRHNNALSRPKRPGNCLLHRDKSAIQKQRSQHVGAPRGRREGDTGGTKSPKIAPTNLTIPQKQRLLDLVYDFKRVQEYVSTGPSTRAPNGYVDSLATKVIDVFGGMIGEPDVCVESRLARVEAIVEQTRDQTLSCRNAVRRTEKAIDSLASKDTSSATSGYRRVRTWVQQSAQEAAQETDVQ